MKVGIIGAGTPRKALAKQCALQSVRNRQITAVELFEKVREYEKRNNCDLFLEFASDESGAGYNGNVDSPETKLLFCFKDIEELIGLLWE